MTKQKMETMDGNSAAAYVSYAFTEVAAIYPITPLQQWVSMLTTGQLIAKRIMFGQPVLVLNFNQKGALQAQSMVHLQQGHSQQVLLHHRVFC